MSWILIVYVLGFDLEHPPTVYSIPFHNEKSCQVAARLMRNPEFNMGRQLQAACVQDGGK